MQGRRAGIVSRVLADAIDLLIVMAIAIVAYLGVSAVLFIVRPQRFTWPHPSTSVSSSVVALLLVLYLAIGWSDTGRTPGKQVMGLRLVNRRGVPPFLWSALLRAVLCLAFPLGLVWSLFDRTSRSLQDLLMGTSVLHDWQPHRLLPRDGRPRTANPGSESSLPSPTAQGGEPGSEVRTETAFRAGSERDAPRSSAHGAVSDTGQPPPPSRGGGRQPSH
jgi:uncharacterized RDD family membrane protein YckC